MALAELGVTEPFVDPLPLGVQEPDMVVAVVSETQLTWLPVVALLHGPVGSMETAPLVQAEDRNQAGPCRAHVLVVGVAHPQEPGPHVRPSVALP
jgi:hypothetical protein